MAVEPKQVAHTDMPAATDPPVPVVLYVCETPDCAGSVYASSSFRPDRSPGLGLPQAQRTHDGSRVDGPSRLACPNCGKERTAYVVTAVVELAGALKAIAPELKKDQLDRIMRGDVQILPMWLSDPPTHCSECGSSNPYTHEPDCLALARVQREQFRNWRRQSGGSLPAHLAARERVVLALLEGS